MWKHLGLSGLVVLGFAVTDLRAGAIAPGQYYTDATIVNGRSISNNNFDFGYVVNDDLVFAAPFGFSFTLFGGTYSDFIISNNGNVQFGSSSTSYSGVPLDGQELGRMIAPYWSDLVSGSGPSFVYLAKYPNEAIITWESMGEYGHTDNKQVSFQLVIRGPGYVVPADEGVIGFSYKAMGWGSGSASPSGSHDASAGFGDGSALVNPGEVSYLTSASPRDISNTHVWFDIAAGIPAQAPTGSPEPGTWIMLGGGIGAIGLSRLRVRFTGHRG